MGRRTWFGMIAWARLGGDYRRMLRARGALGGIKGGPPGLTDPGRGARVGDSRQTDVGDNEESQDHTSSGVQVQGQLAETLGRGSAKALDAVLVCTDRDFAQIKGLGPLPFETLFQNSTHHEGNPLCAPIRRSAEAGSRIWTLPKSAPAMAMAASTISPRTC
jgi:hypothetical protein